MTVEGASTSNNSAPRSWSEDLSTYRDSRGSRSYSSVSSSTAAPKRYGRTTLVPFSSTTHPLYPYNDFVDQPDKTAADPDVQTDRYNRHGWGDVSLLKEEGYSGVPHRSQRPSGRSGKARPGSPVGPDGRQDLFGTLQYTESGGADAWIGNQLINPLKGKRAVQPPPDPKGRRDLFDVLSSRNPCPPSGDSWLGNIHIDPAKGKGHAPGPEERRGRRDLQEIYTQGILRETEQRRWELLQRGADPLADGWVGHPLINPGSGKAVVGDVKAAQDVLHGSTFRGVPPGFTDFPKRHARQVEPPVTDMAREVLNGTGTGSDWGSRGKRHVSAPRGTPPLCTDRKDTLYAHMTYRPLTAVETRVLSRAFDDAGKTGRRTLVVPGSQAPDKGLDLLHWKPETRISSFVPYAGLSQEARRVKSSR
mmetsp:Transcript_26064/g.56910  ORF Transcript_26064/g.56910 Transcript_26064/m.56910 type:complete len:419 (-) Transcript_26064:740-1996(-)